LEETEAHIAFCTFHQSFSYEDFIEGIKPVMSDKKSHITDESTLEKKDCEKGLEYEIQDGVFKQIAQHADSWDKQEEKSKPESFSLTPDEVNGAVFYKMSLGNSTVEDDDEIYKYCIANNKIALGWGGNVDFTAVKDEATLYELAKAEGIEEVPARFVSYLKFALKIGNYVVISKGNTRIRAIAKVTGDYYFDSESEIEYNHFRDVEWIIKDEDIPVKEFYKKSFMQQSLYKLKNQFINPDFFKATEKPVDKIGEKEIRRNHVLIIDEINRGNVSQIFGELITLIEKDKRKGQPEELSVTLPYSKEKFSVPPNLYIIGTMNTADRSIEALDTALRRRFTFKEMPPRPELASSKRIIWDFFWRYKDVSWKNKEFVALENGVYNLLEPDESFKENEKVEIWEGWKKEGMHVKQIKTLDDIKFTGIDVEKLLTTINSRIEKLIDKDHKIGHSYFMSVRSIDDLKNCFKDKIIPLLEEYFYGDFGKIGLVLGDGFVKAPLKNEDFEFATFEGYDADIVEDFKQRKVYGFTDIDSWNTDTFKSIYA
jgi:5-methylcytosine-specific restriction protein B